MSRSEQKLREWLNDHMPDLIFPSKERAIEDTVAKVLELFCQPSEPAAGRERPDRPGLWFQEAAPGIWEGRYVYSDDAGDWRYMSGGSTTGLLCQDGSWHQALPGEVERLRGADSELKRLSECLLAHADLWSCTSGSPVDIAIMLIRQLAAKESRPQTPDPSAR